MRTMKIWAVVLLALLLIAAALAYGLYRLSDSLCGNEVVAEIYSPGTQLKATVFRRDCGATTAFTTDVSITQASAVLPNASGSVFSADTNHGEAPAAAEGGPVVTVAWDSDDALVIRHHPAARVFQQDRRVSGVRVRYVVEP